MIFGMLKEIYTTPPRGVLWVMLNGSQKYYKKIICKFLSGPSLIINYFYMQKPRAKLTPKLFYLQKPWAEFTIDLLKIFFPRAEFTIAQLCSMNDSK
jgi:hypothetical protein